MTGWLRNVFGADKANDAQVKATQESVAGQQEALNYLKQREQLPMQIRDQALTGLSEYYKVPGAPKSQQELIQEAMNSPLYASIMGTKDDALDSIARYSSATGGFRSGNAQANLGRESQKISNQALLDSFDRTQAREDYNQKLNLTGLTGLAGITGNDNAIAGLTADIGNTKAAGTVAQANTQTAATNNVFNSLLGLGSIAAQWPRI